jgi:hypothetical protein
MPILDGKYLGGLGGEHRYRDRLLASRSALAAEFLIFGDLDGTSLHRHGVTADTADANTGRIALLHEESLARDPILHVGDHLPARCGDTDGLAGHIHPPIANCRDQGRELRVAVITELHAEKRSQLREDIDLAACVAAR